MNRAQQKEEDIFTDQVVKDTEEADKWEELRQRVTKEISDHDKDKVSTESDIKVIILMPYERNRALLPETTP